MLCFNHSISFKKLALADLVLLTKWLAEPHVRAWWHEALTLEEARKRYGPRIDGSEPCYVYIILSSATPVGFIQWYRWADYPEHSLQLEAAPDSAGIDLAIGEKDLIGCGLGTQAICQFIQEGIFQDSSISSVIADPEERNAQSIGAFKKAGFVSGKLVQLLGEPFSRRVVRFNKSINSKKACDRFRGWAEAHPTHQF
ncbi:MAG: GNAT family N-acetyltransferase [Bryobacteraceae bacterium]